MPHFRTSVTPCCWCRCWRCCCCSCCSFGSLTNLTHIQLAKCTWKCTCNPMPELSGGTISWGRCTSIGNAACCQDVLSPQQLHHPKRMQEIITQTHTQSDCHVRQAEGGAKKEAKVSVQQCWKNCHVHESRLINSKGQNAQHHSLPSLCPYISSACRRPPLPFPLPYGALDRDANVTRTAAAHSHAPNFHYQMRTFIYKLFLFSCCFRFFLSGFFFHLFLFLLLSSFVSCVAFVALIFLAHIIIVASQVASLPLVARNFLLAISCISFSHLGNFSNPLFACGFLWQTFLSFFAYSNLLLWKLYKVFVNSCTHFDCNFVCGRAYSSRS